MENDSQRSHRLFMALSSLVCLALGAALAWGWRAHYQKQPERLAAMRLAMNVATGAEQESPRAIAAADATAGSSKPEAAEPTQAPSDAAQMAAVSLAAAAPNAGMEEEKPLEVEEGVPPPVQVESFELAAGSPELAAAGHLLDAYLAAKSWQDKVPLVWDSQRVRRSMEWYYEEGGKDPEFGPLNHRGRYIFNGMEVLYFSFDGSRILGSLELVMRRGQGNEWLVDWESFVGAGEMSWSRFKKERPTQPVLMRVFMKAGDYYNYEFTDANRFQSYTLYDANGDLAVYAYCERISNIAAYLGRELDLQGRNMKGFAVRLAYPENAESSQCVWIREVVAPRWLLQE